MSWRVEFYTLGILHEYSYFIDVILLFTYVSSADNQCKTVWTQIRPDKNVGPDLSDKNVGPDLDPNCLTLMVFLKEIFKKDDFEKIKHAKFPSRQRVKPLKRQSQLQQTTNFSTSFLIFKKIRYDIWRESSASRRFPWNIMPYLLFLKKLQNLKLSSAANYRLRFKG